VLFNFRTSRGGEHPQRVLQDVTGTLVTDDHSGCHKLQRTRAITGTLFMAYARPPCQYDLRHLPLINQ